MQAIYQWKKLAAIMLLALLLLLAACGPVAPANSQAENQGPHIVATVFPVYDWLRQIIGDNPGDLQLTLLLADGTDMHSFQPSVDDMVQLLSCDLFVCLGGESEEWVEEALAQQAGSAERQLRLLDELVALGAARQEEEISLQQPSHSHAPAQGAEMTEHDHALEYDEHIWLSLRNGERLVPVLAERLGQLDPDRAAFYAANAEDYVARLTALDEEYQAVVRAAAGDTLLFADRFPFLYLTEDYGLTYYAAFSGCYADAEASFATITYLAGKLDELNLGCVLTLEKADDGLAQTIIGCTKSREQQILALNSMQSVTWAEAQAGCNYLDIMQDNLEVLKQALQ